MAQPTPQGVYRLAVPRGLLKRKGDRDWGTTGKLLSGLSLCLLVRSFSVGFPEDRPLHATKSTFK